MGARKQGSPVGLGLCLRRGVSRRRLWDPPLGKGLAHSPILESRRGLRWACQFHESSANSNWHLGDQAGGVGLCGKDLAVSEGHVSSTGKIS